MFGFGKDKAPKPHASDNFKVVLDLAIERALKAGFKPDGIADTLESRIDDLRRRAALTWSHPAATGINRVINEDWANRERARLEREARR
jgi:hypothetical protein